MIEERIDEPGRPRSGGGASDETPKRQDPEHEDELCSWVVDSLSSEQQISHRQAQEDHDPGAEDPAGRPDLRTPLGIQHCVQTLSCGIARGRGGYLYQFRHNAFPECTRDTSAEEAAIHRRRPWLRASPDPAPCKTHEVCRLGVLFAIWLVVVRLSLARMRTTLREEPSPLRSQRNYVYSHRKLQPPALLEDAKRAPEGWHSLCSRDLRAE